MTSFKEVAHDQYHPDDPHWRLFCDQRKRYRLVVEIKENFTRRDIDKLEDEIGFALNSLHQSLSDKFVPDDKK